MKIQGDIVSAEHYPFRLSGEMLKYLSCGGKLKPLDDEAKSGRAIYLFAEGYGDGVHVAWVPNRDPNCLNEGFWMTPENSMFFHPGPLFYTDAIELAIFQRYASK